LVPESDHGVGVLIAEDAEGRGLQRIVAATFGWLAEPAGGEHTQHVSVSKDQHVTVNAAHLGEHPVGAAADILPRLAARAAVAPQRPVGLERLDLLGGETLVAAVVPFHQVWSHLSLLAISREAAGLERALQWAREDERKRPGMQPGAEPAGLAPALLGQ